MNDNEFSDIGLNSKSLDKSFSSNIISSESRDFPKMLSNGGSGLFF